MLSKIMRFFFFLLFLLPLALCAKISMPFTIDLDPVRKVPKSGSFDVSLSITPNFECSDLVVSIQTFGNIQVGKENNWTEKCSRGQTLNYSFVVSIPANDTTGFEVKVQSGNIWHHALLYFVTSGRKAEVHRGNPKYDVIPKISDILKSEKEIHKNNVLDENPELNKKSTEISVHSPDRLIHDNVRNLQKDGLKINRTEYNIDSSSEINEKIEYSSDNSSSLGNPPIEKIKHTSETIFGTNLKTEETINIQGVAELTNIAQSELNINGDSIDKDSNLRLLPNLRPSLVTGWEDIIVASSVPGTHTINTLYGNQNTYIDWHVNNVGETGVTTAFRVGFYIDGALITYWTINSMPNYTGYALSDYSRQLSPGYHTLKIYADYQNVIPELDETDNQFSRQFYWEAEDLPNLTPYKPYGWDYKIVPSSVSGTHTVNTLYGDQTTYIDWAITNNGTENISETFYNRLYIDNVYILQWSTSSLNCNTASHIYINEVLDYQRTLTSGYHTLKIITDYYDDIDEIDETDNEYSRQFYWESTSLPNLEPYTLSGWDYPIVPSSISGTHTVNTLYADQTTYIDWSLKNTGDADAGRYYTAFYIDGAYIMSVNHTSGLPENSTSSINDITQTLSSGWHTLKIVADYQNEVVESDETDNEYSRQFYWESAALPNLEPYSGMDWDYPIVPSSITGTYTVNTLYANQSTYIDWGVANTGTASAGRFYTALYVDDVYIARSNDTDGLLMNYLSSVSDYEATLTSGWHTLKIVADYLNEVDESDETDNEYSRQFYWEAPSSLVVTGRIRYYDERPVPHVIMNGRNLKIQVWDNDTTSDDDLLWEGRTDNLGYFTSASITNSEILQGTQDIYVKVFSENESCYVQNGVVLGTIYEATTESYVIENILSGIYDYGTLTPGNSINGAFYVADRILDGYNKWNDLRSEDIGQVCVVWPSNSLLGPPTSYDDVLNVITIMGVTDNPDTYDGDVILHEYGHRIEDVMNFYDNSPGGDHLWDEEISSELAGSEGFAHLWSSIVRNDHLQYNWFLNSSGIYAYNNYFDLENGDWRDGDGDFIANANALGGDCEASVAGMLWDIYDSADDDQNSDGIGDTYDNGINNLLSTLLDRNVGGSHPDNSDEFWTAWFSSPSFGNDQQLWAIWKEHGDDKDTLIPNSPAITSCSHTINTLSSDNTISIVWSCSDNGPSGISGYSYEWSQSATTTPNNTVEGSTTTTTSSALANSSNWYFHVKATDRAGNWSNSTHYGPFIIASASPAIPTIASCSHTPGTWSTDRTITISWSSTDTRDNNISSSLITSKVISYSESSRTIAGYSYEWSQSASTVPDNISEGSGTSTTSSYLVEASNWYFHVKAVDQAGNWSNVRHYGPFYIDGSAPNLPTISTCSHTTSSWDNDPTVYIGWNCTDVGGSGIAGYSYEWSQSASTIPNDASEGLTAYTTSTVLANANNWYFHVKAKDNVGLLSPTRHYGPFYIDSTDPTAPSIYSCSHTINTWSNDQTIYIAWSCSDYGGSGLAGYSYEWSQSASSLPNTSIDGTTPYTTSPNLDDGNNWYFHIIAKDNADNWSSVSHYGPFSIYTNSSIPYISINLSPTNSILLSWNPVAGASNYKVYSSTNPYALFPNNWSLVSTPTVNEYSQSVGSVQKIFFRVVAVLSSKGDNLGYRNNE